MDIAVLNGSPRGKFSTTLQSVKYLEKVFPGDRFEIVETASRIRSLEQDFSPVAEAVAKADIILFSYPVYTFSVPCQLHRAVELLKSCREIDWKGKCVAQITTSKHFYDVTAQRFIEDNVRDLGASYLRGLYADMDDLLSDKGRRELVSFWKLVRFRYLQEKGLLENTGISGNSADYEVAVVTDDSDNPVLKEMFGAFSRNFPGKTRVVDISRFCFKGGCMGCFHCAADGECIYKDGYADFLRREIYSASAILFAFTVKDHSMGSLFKMYDDRQFCNGHRMMTIGMPVGYLAEGNMAGEYNLRMMLEARAEVGRNLFCGIVDSASGTDQEQRVADMARLMWFMLTERIEQPQNFYGVGGTKIFRDLIWTMRGLMKADHKFYRKHGIYDDFPQRNIGRMLQGKLLGLMFNNKSIRKKMGAKMNEGMVMPYRKAIEKAVPEKQELPDNGISSAD